MCIEYELLIFSQVTGVIYFSMLIDFGMNLIKLSQVLYIDIYHYYQS